MELYKAIIDQAIQPSLNSSPTEYFSEAFNFVQKHHKEDFERVASTDFNQITPDFFFQEFLWVVYASGFNSKIISKLFPKLLEVYKPVRDMFVENKIVNSNSELYYLEKDAAAIINNMRKVQAVIRMSRSEGKQLFEIGWERYKKTINSPDKLQRLPYIGPITCFHLSRNLGQLEWVKPDRHLWRLARNWKFNDPIEMCKEIQKQ